MGGIEFKRLIRSSGLELTPAQSSYLRQICGDPSGQVGTADLRNVWRLSCATCAPPLPTSSQILALLVFVLSSHGASYGFIGISRDRMSHGMPRDTMRRAIGPLGDPCPHPTRGCHGAFYGFPWHSAGSYFSRGPMGPHGVQLGPMRRPLGPHGDACPHLNKYWHWWLSGWFPTRIPTGSRVIRRGWVSHGAPWVLDKC